MNNPLFKMAGGPASHSIHSQGNNYLGAMHGNGIGAQALNAGIGGNAIGHSNPPPKSQ